MPRQVVSSSTSHAPFISVDNLTEIESGNLAILIATVARAPKERWSHMGLLRSPLEARSGSIGGSRNISKEAVAARARFTRTPEGEKTVRHPTFSNSDQLEAGGGAVAGAGVPRGRTRAGKGISVGRR
ncbi:hypothetical protein E4U21_007799 [Claviceps maximensis]|nr:hypothetical protein E4U21_007799 [Claviceps maximensis]